MVFLTVYYAVATTVQSWRLNTMYQKIARILESKNSVVFLKNSDGSSDGVTAALASSYLCANSAEATVGDCFWSNDVSQGISVSPKQLIYLNPFISFPQSPSTIPFKSTLQVVAESAESDLIYTLIETELPDENRTQSLEIESFGKLLAWKVDTRLAMLMEMDARKLSVLILNTFLQNNYSINEGFEILRVETVKVEGKPQEFDEIVKHSRWSAVEVVKNEDWEKHLEGIKNLSVLANQASEFEYKKNLTEGKTGIVQPDLISSKNIEESLLKAATSPDTPKKKMMLLEKTEGKILGLKVERERQELLKSPVVPFVSFPRTPDGRTPTPDSPKFPTMSPAKSPTPSIKSKTSAEPLSPKFPTGSPAKSSTFITNDKPSIVKMEPKVVKSEPKVIENESEKVEKKVEGKIDEKNGELVSGNDKNLKKVEENKPNIQELSSKNPDLTKSAPKPVKIESPQESISVQKPQPSIKEATSSFLEAEKKSEVPLEPKTSSVEPTKPKPPNLLPIKTSEPQLMSQEAPKLPPSKSSHSIRRKKQKLMSAKPPNILVYSESITTRDNVIKTLGVILQKNTYTIYPLTPQQVRGRIWLDNTSLLIVCGSVNGSDVGTIFLEYFFKGGKVLCLCSDLLRHVLPTYHTAEVREHELVQFSYGKWKNIKMMHHIFCYQPSPVRKHFSMESDDPPKERPSSAENPLLVLLRSVELRDEYGVPHNIKVQTLGTEDTWKTPSLLMVYTDNGGKIVFSQIHLEVDPSVYEGDDQKYQVLIKNDGLRYEIFGDVLSSHLGLLVDTNKDGKPSAFTRGYLLGKHELKFEVLEQLKSKMESNNLMKLDGLSVKFCGKNEDPPKAEAHCLPVMMHSCPDDFSTLDFFDTLKTEHVGRLLIYSTAMASSTALINKIKYCHGFGVIPRELTLASGRGSNSWLSPPGCLMFSLQLHIPLSSPLGQRVSLIQHLVATSVVMAIQKIPGYEVLDIKLKWPNDIYADSDVKIGGLIVSSLIEESVAICNIGLGVNFSNSIPTTCINDLIKAYNKKNSKNLPLLTFEKTLAHIFNEIEFILNRVQTGDMDYLYDLYYKCWLHNGSSVTVMNPNGQEKTAQIIGIDDYGFLKIQLDDTKKIESVQPDGNSYDMIRGLIIPKTQ